MMTNYQNLQAVMDKKIPEKVPHFELDFQIFKEAVGVELPSFDGYENSTKAKKDYFIEQYLDVWELVLEKYNWAAFPTFTDALPLARKRFDKKYMTYTFNGEGTFWMMPSNDMVDFVVDLYENPDDVHVRAREKCRVSIELAKKQADLGAEFLCINSDYGFNAGPFISPTMFAEFVTPYLAEVVQGIHDLGLKAILHSDGDLRKILDQLVSTGIDGYQSIDPQGNMDIKEVKREYGDKLILMGNVMSSALQGENEDYIRESVRYAMQNGAPGGSYIFSTSNCVFNGMPVSNYHIMLDEYEKFAYMK